MRAVQAQRLLMPTEGAALELLLPEATFSICKLRLRHIEIISVLYLPDMRELLGIALTLQ